MTQRERSAAGGATDTAPPLAPGHALLPRPERLAPAPASLSWDDLFQYATPSQQQELLVLARQQGLLYAHQLPPLGNGHGAQAQRPWQRLQRILSGKIHDLEPL